MTRISDPLKIEGKSFDIIDKLLISSRLSALEREVLRRVVHATTDVDYIKSLSFHRDAVRAGVEALRDGRDVICDVNMVKSGVNKKILSNFGGKIVCYIDDKTVVERSSETRLAKAILAMRKASKNMDGAVIAIGNAPTALFEVCDMVSNGKIRPALIIGIPVGFVGAADSKEKLKKMRIPYITNSGTKGGSSVAAAITNALLKIAERGSL